MKLLKQLIFLSLFVPFIALGTDNQGGIAVSATGQSVCTIVDGTLNFGNYTGIAVNGTASALVKVSCSGNVSSVNIAINGGMHENLGLKRMQNTTNSNDYIPYYIGKDASTPGWAAPITFPLTYNNIGYSLADISVYGFIDGNLAFTNGATYTDTLTITTSF